MIHPHTVFKTSGEQEDWVRAWVYKNLGFTTSIRFLWYEGKYRNDFGSIFPIGDLTEAIPEGEGDVIVLEEPEHICWFHHGDSWCEKFNFVVGVVHTNYWNYAINDHQVNALARGPAPRSCTWGHFGCLGVTVTALSNCRMRCSSTPTP